MNTMNRMNTMNKRSFGNKNGMLVPLGNNAIMYGDKKNCGYCDQQDKILKKHFKNGTYLYKKSSINKPVSKLLEGKGIPCWYIPTGNGKGVFHEGLISEKGTKVNGKKITLKSLLVKRKNRFGDAIPQINTLAKYGKNFPDNNGFQVGNNFLTDVTNKWGNPLLSGTLGREFGPGNVDKIYSNNYFNNIRMAYPGGDLDTAINTNRSCNLYNSTPSPSGKPADPVTYGAGMIYNSVNPQIVGMNSFGKRKKNRFGNLYNQMGPVPHKNYLLNADWFNKNYAGGGQSDIIKPHSIQNKQIYIGQAKEYYPVQSTTGFGTRSTKTSKLKKPKIKLVKSERQIKEGKSKKPKEGDTISIKNGKIKIH
jgi:hypothetical protein